MSRNADEQLNEYDNPFGHEGNPHAVAQGHVEIEKLNKAPFSDQEIGPGTKDFDGD
jgi:hypothetical protein